MCRCGVWWIFDGSRYRVDVVGFVVVVVVVGFVVVVVVDGFVVVVVIADAVVVVGLIVSSVIAVVVVVVAVVAVFFVAAVVIVCVWYIIVDVFLPHVLYFVISKREFRFDLLISPWFVESENVFQRIIDDCMPICCKSCVNACGWFVYH